MKRQISKKTGKEYARLVLEDFHGTAEAIVFPEAWAKLNQTDPARRARCSSPAATATGTGARITRPFIVESARAAGRAQERRARWR